ncbi:MAG: putative metalloprotease CJM1_0395 family protein [Planctomycetota bacterium]
MLRIDSQTGRATGPPVVPDDSSYPIRPAAPEAVRGAHPTRDDERSTRPGEAIQDELKLSPEALALAASERLPASDGQDDEKSSAPSATQDPSDQARAEREAAMPTLAGLAEEADGEEAEAASTAAEEEESESTDALSPHEEEIVRDLRRRDREVRSHEQAHQSAAGSLSRGGVQINYERGPDGRRYAVSGSVDITLREGESPEETLRIAQQAQRAATAPADPSPRDRQVAADAARLEQEARRELQTERAEASDKGVEETQTADPTRPTDAGEVSESAPSDARPDPAQVRAAEVQADASRDRSDEGSETATAMDREKDARTLGLSRRAVQAYSETNDLSREPDRRPQVYA